VVGLAWFGGATLLGRQHPYPLPATVALAEAVRSDLAAEPALVGAGIPIEVAVPGESADYNEIYALRVLTNRPGAFQAFWDLALFNRVLADQTPTLWITDDRLPNPARVTSPEARRFGPYRLHRRPPPARVRLVGTARAGATIELDAEGFQAGSVVGLWLTAADGRTIDLGQARADAGGQVRHRLALPPTLAPGAYALSLRDSRTGATSRAALTVAP
jgi:hypothetical protein